MEENKQTLYYDELLSILPDGVIILMLVEKSFNLIGKL